jgi:transposase-like protein
MEICLVLIGLLKMSEDIDFNHPKLYCKVCGQELILTTEGHVISWVCPTHGKNWHYTTSENLVDNYAFNRKGSR